MSQADRPTNRVVRRSGDSILSRIGVAVLGLLLISGVIFLVTVYFGGVQGQEFSPTNFQRRDFAYVEVPLVRLQVTPITRQDASSDLEKYLVKNKLLGAPTEDPRWDLVWASSSGPNGQHGEARILCTYLDTVNDKGKVVWLEWSEDHAEFAKILWPAVAKLARQELYSFVPELFVLARSAADAKVLQKDINQAMARSHVFVGRALQAADNHESAVVYFSEALTYQPDFSEALTGRAESYQHLGDPASAEADRNRLRVLSAEASL